MSELRVAAFPRGIDGLLMPARPGRSIALLVEEGRPEAAWVARFAAERMITYRKRASTPLQALGTGELLGASDIAAAMRKHGLSTLLLHGSRTRDIDAWARAEGMALVAAAPRLARDLEHKIRFDALLAAHRLPKPRSVAGPAGALDPLPFAGPVVVQQPESMGGEGTYFVPAGAGVGSLVARGTLRAKEPVLVRERVEGDAYGLTLLVGHDVCALSALRVQCYYPAPRGAARRVFAGVQWLPHAALGPKRAAAITRVGKRLARVLHGLGYRGFANVDLICTPEDAVHLIECNPRPSAATPSLYVWPELLHGLPVDTLYLAACRGRAKRGGAPRVLGLPHSTFAGSVLDVPADLRGERARSARRGVDSGVYQLGRGGLRFRSPDPAALGPRGTLFAFGSVRRGERFGPDDTLVNVVCSLPLFDARGRLSARGRRVLAHFEVT
jgi:hypothetical protein